METTKTLRFAFWNEPSEEAPLPAPQRRHCSSYLCFPGEKSKVGNACHSAGPYGRPWQMADDFLASGAASQQLVASALGELGTQLPASLVFRILCFPSLTLFQTF